VARPDKEWNSEEIEALTTSYDRYPVGVANRWEKITNYVNNILQFKDGLLTQVLTVTHLLTHSPNHLLTHSG